jgi:hypothetical protein
MNVTERYYKHSGKFNLAGVFLIILLCSIVTPLLSIIYAYGIHYIPLIYVNAFLTLGLGLLVGMTVSIGAKTGKVRNMALVFLFGLLFGLFAEYCSWVSWIYILSDHQQLLPHPQALLEIMQPLAANGMWTVFGWTPTGMALYAIWLIEGIMIVGFAGLMAYAGLNDLPFCEQCMVWTLKQHTSHPLEPVTNTSSMVTQLEQKNLSGLKGLMKAEAGGSAYTQLELKQCPNCQQDGYLTLKSVTISTDEKGKSSKKEATVLENLILDNAGYAAVKAIG